MQPKNRNRRIAIIAFCGLMLALGVTWFLSALNDNTQFFYNPSEILADNFVPKSPQFRVGGVVLSGSISKHDNAVTKFLIGDFVEGAVSEPLPEEAIMASYQGILPDLFREGQGVVITGELVSGREVLASEVLAKHDENYQPKIEK